MLVPLPGDWLQELERFRLQSRRAYRPNMSGGHLMRRRGQSLEFREFSPYTPGDDIRHIDWRASSRSGAGTDLLIRKFAAEETMSLAISVDVRATMRLPEALPKLQIACWLAESLARIALEGGDRVILHGLFGGSGEFAALRGANAVDRVAPTLARLCREEAVGESPNLAVLASHLPPASVWLMISDFYFEPDRAGRAIVRQLASARDGLRWVMMADMDAWPYEKALLGLGPRRIEGPGLMTQDNRFDIDRESLQKIEAAMDGHKRVFRHGFQGRTPDMTHWVWPGETQTEAFDFFKHRFGEDALLRQLFMKAA